jgi:hypothetical protein
VCEILDDAVGKMSRTGVGSEHIINVGKGCAIVLLERGVIHFGNLQPGNPSR